MPYDWGGRDTTPSTGGFGARGGSDRMNEHQRARSVFDIRGLGNSTLDDIGNWLGRQLGLYEGMPTGDEEFSGKAAWGFDPTGLAVGLAGNALGIPGLGYLAEYLSEEAGRPLGINLGTNVFGDDTPAAPYARGASSPQVAMERALRDMVGTGGYGARSGVGGRNMGSFGDVLRDRLGLPIPGAKPTPKPTPKPTTPAEPVLTPGQKAKKELSPILDARVADITRQLRGEARNRGLDPGAYTGLYDRAINDMIAGLDPNWKNRTAEGINALFPTGSAPGVFDTEQTRLRNKFSNDLGRIAPAGYSQSMIRDDFDDQLIDRILGEQRTAAEGQVENAYKRGNLSDVGRTAALGELGNQATTGRARLNELGNAGLSRYRTALDEMISGARSGGAGYTLGGTLPNLRELAGGLNSRIEGFRGGLEGDLRRVAPTDLFDVSSILNTAGTAQGAQNETRNPVLDALAARSKKSSTTRGLGSQGAF